jgi:hypothetical protein
VALLVLPVLPVQKVTKAPVVLLVPPVHKANEAKKANEASKANKALAALLVRKVHLEINRRQRRGDGQNSTIAFTYRCIRAFSRIHTGCSSQTFYLG